MHKIALFLSLMGLGLLASAGVKSSQIISLQPGWNAFYLEVAPEMSADEFFADWPVDRVAAYDSASFLETKQYSAEGSNEGTTVRGYRVWRRDAESGFSDLTGVSANTIYLVFNKDSQKFVTTVYGRPQAPRFTWHISSSTEAMNLVGVSIKNGEEVSLGEYFDGLDTGATAFYAYNFWGTEEAPKLSLIPANSKMLKNGDAIAMTTSKLSDWSGVLKVSPISGFDFSTNETRCVITVVNESSRERKVRIGLDQGNAPSLVDLPPVIQGLFCRAGLRENWRAFSPENPYTATLGAGEKLDLELALDRSQLKGTVGTLYGAKLSVTDETEGGSGFAATIPLEAKSDGGEASKTAWPHGVWIAKGVLDEVTYFGPAQFVTNEVESATNPDKKKYVVTKLPDPILPSGGEMVVRLPMYVDADGKVKLLQRFLYGDTNMAYRVSTPFLPTDQKEIPADSGSFATSATFPFVVSEISKVNPMRHAFHPQHDGLKFDFKSPAPSGDDLDNYLLKVKPEIFSITNCITFVWDDVKGTRWSPEETVSGTLEWDLDGIRHEGTVQMRGKFTMKRISKGPMITE